MRRNLHMLLVACCSLFFINTVFSAENKSEYTASVPVASQNEGDRQIAFKQGLKQVFIEASHDEHVLENRLDILSAFDQAEHYIDQFTYSKNTGTESTQPYILAMDFSKSAIDKLLNVQPTNTSQPSSLPIILVWAVVDQPNHPGDILDSSSTEVQNSWEIIAKKNNTQLLFPMMDMDDLNQVNSQDVVNGELTSISKASARYDADGVIIGGMKVDGTKVQSHWTFIYNKDKYDWKLEGTTPVDIFNQLMSRVSPLIKPSSTASKVEVSQAIKQQLTVEISNVQNQTDLVALMDYLQQQSGVSQVQLSGINGSDIQLTVSYIGAKKDFIKAVLGNKKLANTEDASLTASQVKFHWLDS